MKNQPKVIAGIAAAFALLGSAAGLSNLLPARAQAQVQPAVVTCVPYQQVGNWPVTYIQLCGVTDPQNAGGLVNNALIGINGTSGQSALASAMIAQQKKNKYLGQFYVFPSSTEFLAWASGKNIPISTAAALSGVAGQTLNVIGPNNTVIPEYTVIFETVKYTTPPTRPNLNFNVGSNLGNVAAHESGHWLDALLAIGPSVQTLKYLSNTQFFRDVYDADYNGANNPGAINNLVACGQNAQGLFNTTNKACLHMKLPNSCATTLVRVHMMAEGLD